MSMKFLRKILIFAIAILVCMMIIPTTITAATNDSVYVIKLHGEVNSAMVSYLQRELEVAKNKDANVIIDIDTWGGFALSTYQINEVLLETDILTTAYVSEKAISAGVALAISCDNVAMASDAYIGATEPIPLTEKSLSVLKGMLSATAEEKNRPENVIIAMADSRVIIDGYSSEGELLTLTASQAQKLGVSDATCNSIDEVISTFDLGTGYENATYSIADAFAKILTGNIALTILFTLGLSLAILEVFMAGFGIAGFASILCFGLYFFGGYIAGVAQWWAIVLFVSGIVALIVEMIIPGFGVFGIAGILLTLLGIMFSANNINEILTRLGLSILVVAILIPLFIKIFGKAHFFERLINNEVQTVEAGYVASNDDEKLLGEYGLVLNTLHPIGIIEINGKRLNAMAYGEFINTGCKVVVTQVIGSKIIVEQVTDKQ